jgi:hypothetical protein
MKAVLLLAFAATASANDPAMEILRPTAEVYRKSGQTEFNVTVQTLEPGGEKVSERSAVFRTGFDQIDQHVSSAVNARQDWPDRACPRRSSAGAGSRVKRARLP